MDDPKGDGADWLARDFAAELDAERRWAAASRRWLVAMLAVLTAITAVTLAGTVVLVCRHMGR